VTGDSASGADGRLAAAANDAGPLGVRPAVLAFARHDSIVITSGQVAVRDGVLIGKGTVGDEIDIATARDCARQCARNVLAAVAGELGSLSRVDAVIRLTVYVASAAGFTDQHLVADAASDFVLEVMGPSGAHARTALGVRGLPLGSAVEVDMILAVH
jgi:enamine deaminase RidA (YjgF/YER057c/UK114 family)